MVEFLVGFCLKFPKIFLLLHSILYADAVPGYCYNFLRGVNKILPSIKGYKPYQGEGALQNIEGGKPKLGEGGGKASDTILEG